MHTINILFLYTYNMWNNYVVKIVYHIYHETLYFSLKL